MRHSRSSVYVRGFESVGICAFILRVRRLFLRGEVDGGPKIPIPLNDRVRETMKEMWSARVRHRVEFALVNERALKPVLPTRVLLGQTLRDTYEKATCFQLELAVPIQGMDACLWGIADGIYTPNRDPDVRIHESNPSLPFPPLSFPSIH